MDQDPNVNQNPAPDPNAAAPDPNAQAPQDPNANLPQGMTPNAPTQQPVAPAPQGQPGKSSAWLWILLVVLILVIGGGAVYYFLVYSKKPITETTTPSTTTTTETQKTDTAEDYYNEAESVEPTGEKAIAVNTELMPILQTVFTNVKLSEESELMLTYVVKREIVAADVTSVKTALEGAGYTAIDSSEKQLTMSKGASTWVISFKVGNTEKATIDVTF